MEFKDKLFSKRNEFNLTQDELGRAIGVSKGTISKWEHGNIENLRRDNIAKLAEVLQVTPAYLMGWDDEMLNDAAAKRLLYSIISVIPFMHDIKQCCSAYGLPFEPIVSYFLSDKNFVGLLYLIQSSSLKQNDSLFLANYFRAHSIESVLKDCLNKDLRDSLACYSREEVNLITRFRELPENQKVAVRAICNLDQPHHRSAPSEQLA